MGGKRVNAENGLCVQDVRIRYFAYNCLEIKLPDGKTLVIDPCLRKDGRYACGYGPDVLEGCDYVLINHTHLDHVASLGDVYDRFHPIVMAHAATVMELAEFYDIPYIKMVPFTDGDVFDYGSFRVEILRARHNPAKMFMVRPSGRVDETAEDRLVNGALQEWNEREKRLFHLGSAFNSNFLLTLPNNLRLGLFAGNPGMAEPEDRNLWRGLHPDILFAHRAPVRYENWAERMAENLAVTGARLMIPIHLEDAFLKTIDPQDYAAQINRVCDQRGIAGRAFCMERAKWYDFYTGICPTPDKR